MNIKNTLGYTGILKFEFERDKSYKLEFHNNGKYPLFETIGKVLTGNISNDILIPTYLDIVTLDSNKNVINKLLHSPTILTNGTLSRIPNTDNEGIIITYLASVTESNLISNNLTQVDSNDAVEIRLLDRSTTKVLATVTIEGEDLSSDSGLVSKLSGLRNGLTVAMEWSLIFDNNGNGGNYSVFTK